MPHLVCFRLDQRHYALPVECVERAVRMVAVTPLPESPAHVVGSLDVHGHMIPVVDPRRPLGHAPRASDPDDHLLIVRAHEITAALIVDEVTDLCEVSDAEIGPSACPGQDHPFVSSTVRLNDRLVLLLRVERLVPMPALPRRRERVT